MQARQPPKIDWPSCQRLQTGDFTAIFDQGAFAHLSLRAHELIRLIYVAIRAPAWNTVPTVPLSVHLCSGSKHFIARIKAIATGSSLDLEWELDARGSPDGNLQMNFRARARRDCTFARIGLCLHFDADRFKAARWEADILTTSCRGRFPSAIHPQFLVDGILQPCIPAFSSMRITLDTQTALAISLEGDQFEIEDQRNWTDASFKAYTTPLALGELHHLAAGETIEQRLHISCRSPCRARTVSHRVVQARPLAPLHRHLPRLGAALANIEATNQRHPTIRFAHWRVDIRSEADVEAITACLNDCHGGTGIELVLHPDAVPDDRLEKLARTAARSGSLTRVILLGPPESLPSPERIRALKAMMTQGMGNELPIGAGAPSAYADLARDLNDFSAVDFISIPISPQSHVFDKLSIFETLSVQEQVVRETSRRTDGGMVVVSPLTFGLQEGSPWADNGLPGRDRRIDEIGAAWLGASLGRLALGGADAVTLAPDLWMSPGLPTALSELLQIYMDLDKAALQPFEIDDPRRIFIFGARQDNETMLFLINLTGRHQTLHLNGSIAGELTAPQRLNTEAKPALPVETCSETGATVHLAPYQIRILRQVHS